MWTLGLLLGRAAPDGGCGSCLFDIIFWGILIVLVFSLIKIYWALILLIMLVIIILKKVTSSKREEFTCSNRILEADIEIALDSPKVFFNKLGLSCQLK